jgi:NitT/TauT family transport system ATP-binding protein
MSALGTLENISDANDVELSHVSMTFQTAKQEIKALDDISFSVKKGEFVAIVGSSGCGKSTLLRIIAGLLQASSGKAYLRGQQIVGPDSKTGIVFQTPALLPWRNVFENIELQLQIRGIRHRDKKETVERLIALVGLKGFECSMPYQLSGGMQQRVALCRALVHEPALLLMDEPFGALDALTREQMNLELQQIWLSTKKTVVFITHSILEAVFLADRVIVMSPRPGRITSIVELNLPRPRTFETMRLGEFHEATDRIRQHMNALGPVG